MKLDGEYVELSRDEQLITNSSSGRVHLLDLADATREWRETVAQLRDANADLVRRYPKLHTARKLGFLNMALYGVQMLNFSLAYDGLRYSVHDDTKVERHRFDQNQAQANNCRIAADNADRLRSSMARTGMYGEVNFEGIIETLVSEISSQTE